MPETAIIPKQFVATGFVVQKGKTLLVLHKKLKMWLPPGGHIDPGETPDEAVLREIREETGLEVEIVGEKRSPDPKDGKVKYLHRPAHIQVEDIDDPKGFHHHIDLIYFCRPVGGEVRLATGEHHDIRWFSDEDLGSPDIVEEVRETGRRALRALA